MHTFCGEGCRIHYNSDLSGDVIIVDKEKNNVTIPGKDIVSFVAEYIRLEEISKLEQMTPDELLNNKNL